MGLTAHLVIQAALNLCRQHGAAASVLYVEPVFEGVDSARRYVRGIVHRFLEAGVDARAEGGGGVAGVPVQIVEAVERIDADLIVIGSRRRGELAAVVMGSMARELVHLTERPVLLAGAPARHGKYRPGPPSTRSPGLRTRG